MSRVVRVLGGFALGVGLARAATRPDVIVLLTDQQRADALGVAGNAAVHTPVLDRLAREGANFTNAYCATPQCSPSRAALLTGLYPHRSGVMGNVAETGQAASSGMSPPLDRSIATLGRLFAASGYDTAYFGKWHLGADPGPYGFAHHDSGRPDDSTLAARVQRFLKTRAQARTAKPLLLVASWLNPHEIYDVAHAPADPAAEAAVSLPRSLTDDLGAKPFPQRHYLAEDQGKPFRGYTPEQWRRYLVFYNRLVEKVDGQIGEVLGEARRTNPDALVLFSSDHGDLGGAHGLPFKGPAMYEELVRIPLILVWPGKIVAQRSEALVSNVDLLPTLCDLAGIAPPYQIDGRSLRPVIEGKPGERDVVFAEYYGKQNWRVPIRMVRTRTWKYIRYQGYGEELYDLVADPVEMHNLGAAAQHARTRAQLGELLDRFLRWTDDPFATLSPTDRSGRPLTGTDK